MDFTGVLVEQVFWFDNAAAEQPDDKSSGSGERIKNMNTFIADAATKPLLHHILNRLNDEIHYFNGRVNDAKSLSFFRKRIFEKLFVQLDDDFLLAFSIIDAFGAFLHAGIEFVQRFLFFLQSVIMQHIQHILHNAGYRVAFQETIVIKQCIKNGLCNEMLSKHLDGIILVNTGVQASA